MSLRVSQGKNLKHLDTSTAQSKEQGSKPIYVCLYPQGLVLLSVNAKPKGSEALVQSVSSQPQ